MKIKLAKLLSDVAASRRGATAIEYGLIAALIALVVAGGAAALGGAVDTKLGSVQSCVSATGAAITTACP
mgnify:CR=1 FL=1